MRVSVFLGFLAAVAAAPFSLRAADEASLLGEVDAQALERHARAIVMHPRDGGSPGENAAVDYVVETLRADGIDVEVHVFPGYVSNPGRCALRVEGAEPSEPTCLTQALAASTPQSGVSGELVYVGGGTPSDYENVDVEGKVVLLERQRADDIDSEIRGDDREQNGFSVGEAWPETRAAVLRSRGQASSRARGARLGR